MTEPLTLTIDGRVATLTINRPERRNALSYEMWSAIPGLVGKVAEEPGARVLVIRGTDHFSAGADISEFRTLRNSVAGARKYQAAVHAGERAIATLAKPTIAAVTGFCVGGGCEIALACDLRLARADARFGITPAKLGIVYSFTSTRQLVDIVGPAWAKQILYSADLVDAATALRIGLVNEVHPEPAFDTRVTELAETIGSRAQVSVRGAKTIINRFADGRYDEDAEIHQLYDTAVTSPEYAEGVDAFLSKRPPRF